MLTLIFFPSLSNLYNYITQNINIIPIFFVIMYNNFHSSNGVYKNIKSFSIDIFVFFKTRNYIFLDINEEKN